MSEIQVHYTIYIINNYYNLVNLIGGDFYLGFVSRIFSLGDFYFMIYSTMDI